ncbi:MAG: L,D-transpeptidase [Firmicutes bacterium]|nr:L,D-transpeptidase [Bacillota bacterium]
MKIKKIIAIATAAAFAFTGTCYADTGVNLATEGSDATEVIEDISLSGDRIEADETAYYTGDLNVDFSLNDDAGISSVAIVVNGETLAEKKYDTSNCIETADGEVINADSTVETEETETAEEPASASEPITSISDSLVIDSEALQSAAEAKATEPEAEAETVEPEAETEATEPEAETEATEPETEVEAADPNAENEAAVTETETAPATDPEATVPEAEVAEPEVAAEATAAEGESEVAEPQAEAEEQETETVSGGEESESTEEAICNTVEAEMIVTDVNGQTETKKFDINTAPAKTEAEEQKAESEMSAMGLSNVQVVDANTYRVEVNLTRQAVTFYKQQANGTYKPLKVVVCSSGRSGETTPTGTFKIGPYKKKCGRSRWALLSGGSSYAQYLVRFQHGICFHSVPYKSRGDNSKMYRSQYNKLGGVASAGCVRLRVVDAKWIYDNCPTGTVVKVYRSSTASPLGKPTYKKLGSGSSLCWDPTDPDTGNPAYGGNGKPTGIYIGGTAITYEKAAPVKTVSSDITQHTVKLSTARYVYNGEVRTPAVSIYGLTKNTNFTVKYPEGRKEVGRYDITVTGKETFTGTKTVTFRIYPMSTKITSLSKAGSKKFKVKYKKITKQITGYQIKYSTSSKFSKNCKSTTVKGYKNINKTIKVPKKGTYYVKVRVYKITDKGYKYYSSWSAVKKIRVR